MEQTTAAMKSMKLYDRVERVYNELRDLGVAEGAPLRVEQLVAFDQFHYHGTAALDVAIERLAIGPESRLLEVGAGIGGPARYLAERTACRVTALELQPDLDAVARDLTARCGLAGRVEHLCGNVMDGVTAGGGFDALVSLLVFLHIPARADLLAICRDSLRPGGRLFVEDFTKRREPSDAQWRSLGVKVQCPSLETAAGYRGLLEEAGFRDIDVEDMSESWTAFTASRYAAFRAARPRHLEVHDREIVEGLEDFYSLIAGLYAEGVLGGVRITAARG